MRNPPGRRLQREDAVQIGKPKRIIEVAPDERDRPSPGEPGEPERQEKRRPERQREEETVPAEPTETG